MKKYGIILGILVLSAGLFCGCGEKTAEEAEALPELVIGSDSYEPYNYQSENGEFAGIDVELAREACKRMGYRAVFRKISWEDKDNCLRNGTVDCLWGSFSMNGREDRYLWAGPYLYSRQVLMVRAESDIYGLKDLDGGWIAVQSGSKPEELLTQQENENLPKAEKIFCFGEMDEVVAALRKGYVNACAGHENALAVYRDSSSTQEYRILEDEILISKLGVAFRPDAGEQLVSLLQETLDEMREDGTTAAILEKYGVDSKNLPGEVYP